MERLLPKSTRKGTLSKYDPTVATVTQVDISVLAGPPLAAVFRAALTGGAVLATLTAALRAAPANLLQVTPQQLSLPLQIVQTYQPPKGSVFFPKTLFEIGFSVSRIVARPLTASSGNSGVLAVGIDVSQPISTAGDANALADLTGSIPTGPAIEYGDGGAASFVPQRKVHRTEGEVAPSITFLPGSFCWRPLPGDTGDLKPGAQIFIMAGLYHGRTKNAGWSAQHDFS